MISERGVLGYIMSGDDISTAGSSAASEGADQAQPVATPNTEKAQEEAAQPSLKDEVKTKTPAASDGSGAVEKSVTPDTVAGAGAGAGLSGGFPYTQEADGTCWAASFRNFLYCNGVAVFLIPSEEEFVNAVLETILEAVSSPLWRAATTRLAQQGVGTQEAENVLVPLAKQFGVDAKLYAVGAFNSPYSTVGAQESRFNSIVARGGAMMVNVPASNLSAFQGVGHFVMIQQISPGVVRYVDPRGGGMQSMNTASAWKQYSGWSVTNGGYVIAPKKL